MTRQIVLDTETTGLEVSAGHRVVEIGAIEIIGRQRSGKRFHHYVNPEREIDEGALKVHGLTRAFLSDKPCFSDIADEFLAFVAGAEILIHNAAFDCAMLDAEFARLSPPRPRLADHARIVDTLVLARERFPGQRNRLDDLCKRLDVDASDRQLHGALLDASLLAEVYLALTAGQITLSLAAVKDDSASPARRLTSAGARELVVIAANDDEIAAHQRRLATIAKRSGKTPIWLSVDGG